MSSNPQRNTGPNKEFFRIGEVGRLTGLEPHVIRYWETEFPQIRPYKTGSKQRLYGKKEIETILLVKRLLYEDGYTIAGAKKRLDNGGDLEQAVELAKRELREILEILK